MKIWTKEEEGEALRKRFDDLKRYTGISRAKFAKEHGLKGGDSMVYQHITGHRPMNMEAAIAYAKAFGCDLQEISPRLAEEAKQAAAAIGSIESDGIHEASNGTNQPGRYSTVAAALLGGSALAAISAIPQLDILSKQKDMRQDRVNEIVALLQQTNMEGLAVILDRAKDAAREYPLAKKTPKLSP